MSDNPQRFQVPRSIEYLFSRKDLCSQALRLKKVPSQFKQDMSSPQLQRILDCSQAVTSYQQTCLDANIEQWQSVLQGYTFEAKYVLLTQEHAHALIAAYKRHETGADPYPDKDSQDGCLLADLEKALQSTIDSSDSNGDGVFVKTSCRSAKDAAPALERFQQVFGKSLELLKMQRNVAVHNNGRNLALADVLDMDANDKLVAMLQAGLEMLRYRSASGVFASILRSERVMQDMLLALDHKERFLEHLVVRPWIDIDVDMEFRGFVCDNRLNAVSQYNHLAYFPRLLPMKHSLQRLIEQFFNVNIRERLAPLYDRYVIDFAITGKDLDRIWVIEINPFLETTDGCLFSWTHDRTVLENGSPPSTCGDQATDPFEFRLAVRIKRSAIALVSPIWRKACGLSSEDSYPVNPV